MSHRNHPAPALLRRFLHGEISRSEARVVVRHLLAGCRNCSAALETMALLGKEVASDRRAYREREG